MFHIAFFTPKNVKKCVIEKNYLHNLNYRVSLIPNSTQVNPGTLFFWHSTRQRAKWSARNILLITFRSKVKILKEYNKNCYIGSHITKKTFSIMNYLWILLTISFLVSAVVWIYFIYFFSIGYGLAISALAVATAVIFADTITLPTAILCGTLFI